MSSTGPSVGGLTELTLIPHRAWLYGTGLPSGQRAMSVSMLGCSSSAGCWDCSHQTGVEIVDGFLEFGGGVHHERPEALHWLVDWLADKDHGEQGALCSGHHHVTR